MELELKPPLAQSRLDKLAETALVGFVILLVQVLFSPFNTPVLPRDEGVFVYIGQGILQGKLPYKDLWDHKGPLIYYLNALGLWIGQHSLWGIWLVEALALAVSLVVLYQLLRSVLSREAALFGLLTWAAGFAIVLGGNIVEEYAIPLTVLALVLALRPGRWAGAWLGVLAALGFMLRPNEIAGPVAALLFVLAERRHTAGWKAVIAPALQFGAGFALVAGAVAAYFAANHALPDLLSSVFLFNLLYVSGGGDTLSSLLGGVGYLAVPVFFGVVGLLGALLHGRAGLSPDQKRLLYLAGVLFIAVVPLSLLSGRVYRHYYIAWLLPLSILGSFLPRCLRASRSAGRLPRAAQMLCWTVLVLAVVVSIRIRIVPLLAGSAPPEEIQAVEALRDLAPRDGQLFIWGDETSYAVMAGRRLAGRYIYTSPLLMPGFGESIAPRVLADIAASRPLIIDTAAVEPAASLAGDAPYPYLAPLYAFVHQNYRLMGSIPGKGWLVWGPKQLPCRCGAPAAPVEP